MIDAGIDRVAVSARDGIELNPFSITVFEVHEHFLYDALAVFSLNLLALVSRADLIASLLNIKLQS